MTFNRKNFYYKVKWRKTCIDWLKHLPIEDFHCHLSPQEILRINHLKMLYKYGLVVIIINGV